MGDTRRFGTLSSGTGFRLLVALVVLVVSGIGTEGLTVLPWIGLVVVLDLATALLLYSDPADGAPRERVARATTAACTLVAALGLLAARARSPWS